MGLNKRMTASLTKRISDLNWATIGASLTESGYALLPPLLSPKECKELSSLYGDDSLFRSHIIMSRYRFGRGDYKYFNYPLPELIQEVREETYARLAPIANQWNELLSAEHGFPAQHRQFLKRCNDHGQHRATPLLLHYQAGDFNCLHQDLYGEIAFPLQATCFLSQPGIDYEGGEFVLVEQQPRAQSKPEVVIAQQGQVLIFATRYRPVKGTRGYYRTNLRHGVSRLKSGVRYTPGIIYHDAQ
jgi:uncharacterized protein